MTNAIRVMHRLFSGLLLLCFVFHSDVLNYGCAISFFFFSFHRTPIKRYFRMHQLGQPGVFYHFVQQCELNSLEGLINLSTKWTFLGGVLTFCSKSVVYIVCHRTPRVVVCMNIRLRGLKKTKKTTCHFSGNQRLWK